MKTKTVFLFSVLGSFIESTSRPPTPPAGSLTVEEEAGEERRKKKSKSKKRKKRKSEKREQQESDTSRPFVNMMADVPIPPYYQQFHQQVSLLWRWEK